MSARALGPCRSTIPVYPTIDASFQWYGFVKSTFSRRSLGSMLEILTRYCHVRCAFSLDVTGEYCEFAGHPASQTGVPTDLLVNPLKIPAIPHQLEALGRDGICAKISWLLVDFVRLSMSLNCKPIIQYSSLIRFD